MDKIIKLSILAAAIALAGCSDSKRVVDLHLKYFTEKSAPLNASDADAQAQVANAATSASGSLEELSAIDLANTSLKAKHRIKKPWRGTYIGMSQRGSIDWNGPVEPIVKKIADVSGYHVHVLGTRPPIPVLVNLNMNNDTMADMLRNVMYQVHNKATIAVYPKTRRIELRYFKT